MKALSEKTEPMETPDSAKILIVDDEPFICEILSRLMKKEGFVPVTAHDGDSAMEKLRLEVPNVLLLDFRMPGMNGMEVMKKAKRLDPDLPVVMITAYADIQGAVEAMREGAHDYLAKPFEHHEVIRIVRRAVSERELKTRLKDLSNQLEERFALRELMGPSEVVSKLIMDINRVATSDFSVIILGETGSGKELVARAVHHASPRRSGPFVAIDCGAIPESLLESELFGHEKGSFTGAVKQKPGKFEISQKGTLLLDEMFNMSMASQAKLLRVLQERKIYRVGGTQPIDVDVRLLVATNRDLEKCSSENFRKDLFFRLNEFTIRIPPLRQRKEDIPYLAKRFLTSTNLELQKNVRGFGDEAIDMLLAYDWPGNVRQLRSLIRRAVLMADDMVTEKHLDMKRLPRIETAPKVEKEYSAWQGRSLKEIVRDKTMAVEKEVLTRVLEETGGNKAKAARLLKIDYKTIHTKLKSLCISCDGGEDDGSTE